MWTSVERQTGDEKMHTDPEQFAGGKYHHNIFEYSVDSDRLSSTPIDHLTVFFYNLVSGASQISMRVFVRGRQRRENPPIWESPYVVHLAHRTTLFFCSLPSDRNRGVCLPKSPGHLTGGRPLVSTQLIKRRNNGN